ncbi:MAG: hypothetical protein WCC06_11275 [Candidatus Aminicenantales bacterium]
MYWVRNLERLARDARSSSVEYELASESEIEGVLNYANGAVLCGRLSLEPDRHGLYRYLLRLRLAELEWPPRLDTASPSGYVLRDGIVGELLAILSIALESRFFLLSYATGDLSENGIKVRHDYSPVHRPCTIGTDPILFSPHRRKFHRGVANLMDCVAAVDPTYHQELIFAYNHYAKALREVGIDDELVYVRLVSAIEAVARRMRVPARRDLFACRDLDEILDNQKLTPEERKEARRIFEVRFSKCKFVTFLMKYCTGFFKGGEWKAPHTRVKRADLERVASAIYDARSAYLHAGEPMFISMRIRGEHRWHTDPGGDMFLGERRFLRKKKLPYPYFFHRLVRHCLLRYTATLHIVASHSDDDQPRV